MKTIVLAVLGALALAAAPDTNVTGNWSGTFVMIDPGGETKDSTALLVLKQTGSEISGTVGPNADERHVISKGKIEGDKITIESADGKMTISFNLALVGDRI